MTKDGTEHSKTIIGFFMGMVFSTLINFYWGNSHKTETPPTSKVNNPHYLTDAGVGIDSVNGTTK